jgi:hypothetical protein
MNRSQFNSALGRATLWMQDAVATGIDREEAFARASSLLSLWLKTEPASTIREAQRRLEEAT